MVVRRPMTNFGIPVPVSCCGLDLNTVDGVTETIMRSLLAATLPDDPTTSEATWNELIALALSDAGRAMSFPREKLPQHLLRRHSKITGFSTGVSRLIEDTELVINNGRLRIAVPWARRSAMLSTNGKRSRDSSILARRRSAQLSRERDPAHLRGKTGCFSGPKKPGRTTRSCSRSS